MGYNTTILILNDGLSDIKNNLKEWFDKVQHHIGLNHTSDAGTRDGKAHYSLGDVSAGCHANPSTVVATHHADETLVIAVGGNCATVLGHFWNANHHTDEAQLKLLKEMADARGYRLVKKE